MSLVAQRDRPWTEVLSELVGVSIIGCIPMHPYFAFMQRTGLYTIEQRTGPSLVDVKKLPATFATYAGVSRGIPIVLRTLKAGRLTLTSVMVAGPLISSAGVLLISRRTSVT